MNSSSDTEVGLEESEKHSRTPSTTPSSSSDYVTGEENDEIRQKKSIPHTLEPDLFDLSKPLSRKDLEEMIEKCKNLVLESAECSEGRKWLVRRLIELRLRAQEIRESASDGLPVKRVVMGHHLSPPKYKIAKSMPTYCDHCSGTIWTMLQSWFSCTDCGFCCHWKCVSNICRVCVHVIASETGGYTYTKDICPENGLSSQGYRCAECNVKITFNLGYAEQPRLCDYTGCYYCQRCHWNNVSVIPARVVRNWDTEPRAVSQAANQILALLFDKPVLYLEELNPKLFSLVPDLSLVKRLREELQMMKHYLVVCPEANIQGLPWRSGLRTHFLENSSTYSIKDLIDLKSGPLVEEMHESHETMRRHIVITCDLCKARGHLCELCGNDEVIYPWDVSATSCRHCNAVYHANCWTKRNHRCPKCLRLEQRLRSSSEIEHDPVLS